MRWAALSLIAAMFLVGCSQGSAPGRTPQVDAPAGQVDAPTAQAPATPQNQAPAPASPVGAPVAAPADPPAARTECLTRLPEQPYGRFDFQIGNRRWVTHGTCDITADERSYEVEFILPPGVDEAAVRSGVTYSGSGDLSVRFVHQEIFTRVYVTIPAGPAGEQADLRLAGPWAPGGKDLELAFHITRVTAARIDTEIRLGDGPWEPLSGVRVIPRQPLFLRFRYTGGIDPNEIGPHLASAVNGHDFRLQDPDAGTLGAVVPDPPTRVAFDPAHLKTPYGPALGDAFRLYVGDAPTVVALDPATGEERVIGSAPPDIWTGSVSPDGRWAMLASVTPASCYDSQVWLMDLTTGTVAKTPLDYGYSAFPIAWSSGRLIIPAWNGLQIYHLANGRMETRALEQRAWDWGTASPDGRYLLGYTKDFDRERPDWHAPITVIVYDLETGEERTFPDVAWGVVTHSGAPPMTRLAWTPDGKGILLNDPRSKDPLIGGEAVLHVDFETGTTRPHSLSAPDSFVARPGPGGFSYQAPGLFYSYWGPVNLRSAAGTERQYGKGLVLGWAPDGALTLVRWATEGMQHCEGE